MSVARNILLFGLYTALAISVAVMAPLRIPRLDQSVAVVIGLLIFFAGALIHEMYQRLSRETFLGRQILALRQTQTELFEQLNWTRRENKALAEAVEAVVRSRRPPAASGAIEPDALGEAITEVRVLKSLGSGSSRTGQQRTLLVEPEADSDADRTPTLSPPGVIPGAEQVPPQAKAGTGGNELPDVVRNLSDAQILEQVQKALRDDRISFVLQPIVSLPQRKRRFYECFSRVRTEEDLMILPEEYIAIAEREGLITAIDNMLLFRCVQLVRKIQRRSDNLDFFCNISPHTLRDDDFFGDFVEFLENNEVLGPNLIFEFTQSDFAGFGDQELQHLQRLGRIGCRLSLDQVTDLQMDLPALAAMNIRFVKIEAERLVDATSEVDALIEAFMDVPINLVAEKIESEETLLRLLDKQIDYGQGYLFGEPRLARPAA
jgi:cyclic-di-GMP phosphodiesterase TipF (flagellum assembly factor)